jgi:uroporphyrinogen decarboxylase
MYDVDLDIFWKDDGIAHKENCFSIESPQVALGIRMSQDCVFAELGIDANPWLKASIEDRIELNKRYNDKSEKIVGKRLLPEIFNEINDKLPDIKGIVDVFEVRRITNNSGTVWLKSDCTTPEELENLLDRVEKKRNSLYEFIIPPTWEYDKKIKYEMYGLKPKPIRAVRGPVTLAMSIFGVENLVYLIIDKPDLAKRFSQSISDVIYDIVTIMDNEAGYEPGNIPGGFSFFDDNCCMLTREMYEFFGYPVLKRIFDHWCHNPAHKRYQHSDSDMGHLLPVLSRLNFTGVNFGPKVLVNDIRRYMPKTRIDGCLAPFTFMRNDEKAIIEEVKRDCEMAKVSRGLNLSTAGSINNGSLLTSMRAIMYAIQNYGRY